jgi:light-harvesting complex I chlorophyll a/b binding protein 1
MASKASTGLLLAAGVVSATAETAFVTGGAPSLRSTTRYATDVAARREISGSSEASSSTSLVGVLAVASFGTGVLLNARRSKTNSRKATVVNAFESELGVQAPVGFWDPAGFCSDGSEVDFYRRRVVELKHGRVAMLACTGYIVQQFVKFPGYLSPSTKIQFADVPNGLAALSKVPAVGIFQWVIFCGICDLWLVHQVPTNPPGKLCTRLFGGSVTNYEYGFLGVPGYLGGKPVADPEKRKTKLNAELANGRLAMMAIIGMFFQDGLTGSAWGDWALYTASPLRSFEK